MSRAMIVVYLVLLASPARAGLIELRLEGSVNSIYSEDTFGNDDSESFAELLPFGIGFPISAVFRFDPTKQLEPSGFQSVGYNNGSLDASLSFRIGHARFEPDAFGVSSSRSENSRRLRVGTDRNSSDTNLEFLPTDWSISSDSDVDLILSFSLIDLPSQLVLPSPRLPEIGLTANQIEGLHFILADISQDGGSSTWSVGSGSHTGTRHDIRGAFTSLTVTSVPEPGMAITGLSTLLAVVLRRKR